MFDENLVIAVLTNVCLQLTNSPKCGDETRIFELPMNDNGQNLSFGASTAKHIKLAQFFLKLAYIIHYFKKRSVTKVLLYVYQIWSHIYTLTPYFQKSFFASILCKQFCKYLSSSSSSSSSSSTSWSSSAEGFSTIPSSDTSESEMNALDFTLFFLLPPVVDCIFVDLLLWNCYHIIITWDYSLFWFPSILT